jgi:putative transcriptional regulator
MDQPLVAKLLVATPKLADPNFHRTVVYMLAHNEGGALGVVLTRPHPGLDAGEQLAHWRGALAPPQVVFAGGPVEPAAGLGVARVGAGGAAGPGMTPVVDGIALVDLNRSPDELEATVSALRVFAGHAGWGAGQLEREIAEDAWFVVDAEPGDLFTSEPEHLWREVLRRQRGQAALYAFYPENSSLN